jgi:solute carrier family 50 protein (sugar transporter)
MIVAPWPTIRGVISSRTTGDLSFAPFVMGHVNASLWVLYGLVIGNLALVVSNIPSIVAFSWYCYVFWTHAVDRPLVTRIVKGAAVALAVAGAVALTFGGSSGDLFGLVCCLVTVAVFASPLAKLRQVWQDKSTDSMPFLVSLMGLACSVAWLAVGIDQQNTFMMIPNGCGAALGVAQMVLFLKFKKRATAYASLPL